MTASGGAGVVTRGRVVDMLRAHDGCVVLVELGDTHRVARVSLVGEAVLDALVAGPVSVEDLGRILVDRLGPPPTGDIDTVLEEVLGEMSGLALVAVAR